MQQQQQHYRYGAIREQYGARDELQGTMTLGRFVEMCFALGVVLFAFTFLALVRYRMRQTEHIYFSDQPRRRAGGRYYRR